ncbi:GATA transcription factor 22 [Canna indica]|uniref:GATA transcription factor 22 n=1 Tax=Canna indica TaxID=4628 RepID=A0AAQ3KNB4_9LILI|nr:GATA transcription factor 22 [Canna indica]
MSAFDLNQASIPIDEEEETRDLPNHTSSFSCANLFTSLHHPSADYRMSYQLHQLHQEPKEVFFIAGSSDRAMPDNSIKLSLCNPYVRAEEEEAAAVDRDGKYWMPSKMRLMRKMMSSTHIVVREPRENIAVGGDRGFDISNRSSSSNSNSPNGVVRVCSDCNTTKTPLWRSGPRGPKANNCGVQSLCNACGIRQRKARRAMAAAAAAINGGVVPASTAPVKVRKEKTLDIDRTLPFKKRCKMNTAAATTTTTATSMTVMPNTSAAAAAKNLCFEEVTLSSNKNSGIQKVFPQEERDAAILLMALSCGLVRS